MAKKSSIRQHRRAVAAAAAKMHGKCFDLTDDAPRASKGNASSAAASSKQKSAKAAKGAAAKAAKGKGAKAVKGAGPKAQPEKKVVNRYRKGDAFKMNLKNVHSRAYHAKYREMLAAGGLKSDAKVAARTAGHEAVRLFNGGAGDGEPVVAD